MRRIFQQLLLRIMSCFCILLPIFEMEQHTSRILHPAASPHSGLTCTGKWTHKTEGWGETFIPELEEERIVIGSSAVIVIKVRPLWRQGIRSLHSYTFYLPNRIFPVHTTKMSDKNMERLIVLVIESTLLRRLLRLLITGPRRRTRIRDRHRNEDVVLMHAFLVLPPATSSA